MNRDNYGYYELSNEIEIKIWEECIFVFDTSTLLDFYYFSNDALEDIFTNIFEKVKSRLWITNHVEYEYLKNRIGTLKKPITEKYKPLEKEYINFLDKELNKIKNKIEEFGNHTKNRDQHPYLNDNGLLVKGLLEEYNKFLNNFVAFKEATKQEFSKREEEISSNLTNDRVLEQFENYFTVGQEYKFDKLMDIAEEGEKRFASNIPPGYKDAKGPKAKEGLQKYGDLIIWKQIIDIAKAKQKPIVFILNDNKEDWCYQNKVQKGRIERPREELIREMRDEANVRFWMYNLSQFLYKSKERLNSSLNQKSIDEALSVQKNEVYDDEVLAYLNCIKENIRKIAKMNESILILLDDLDELGYSPTDHIFRRKCKKVETLMIEIRSELKGLRSYRKHFNLTHLTTLSLSVFKLVKTMEPENYSEYNNSYYSILENEEEDVVKKVVDILELFEGIYKKIYGNWEVF